MQSRLVLHGDTEYVLRDDGRDDDGYPKFALCNGGLDADGFVIRRKVVELAAWPEFTDETQELTKYIWGRYHGVGKRVYKVKHEVDGMAELREDFPAYADIFTRAIEWMNASPDGESRSVYFRANT